MAKKVLHSPAEYAIIRYVRIIKAVNRLNTQQYFIDPAAEILPAKDDQIFKSLLTRKEPESKIVLMDLIGSIIGRKVTDVVIKNNEPATMDISQKQ